MCVFAEMSNNMDSTMEDLSFFLNFFFFFFLSCYLSLPHQCRHFNAFPLVNLDLHLTFILKIQYELCGYILYCLVSWYSVR
jgi:putative flippase GtrA